MLGYCVAMLIRYFVFVKLNKSLGIALNRSEILRKGLYHTLADLSLEATYCFKDFCQKD